MVSLCSTIPRLNISDQPIFNRGLMNFEILNLVIPVICPLSTPGQNHGTLTMKVSEENLMNVEKVAELQLL